MKTTDGEGPALPAARAFVVHLHAAAEPARSALMGRVEHIVSAESAHFDTLDELLGFMAWVLDAAASERGSAEPRGRAVEPSRNRSIRP